MANAWARRVDEGESAKAHAALMAYLEYGPERSLEKLSQTYPKSVPLLKRWSREWGWITRADAYDAAQQQIVDEARAHEIRLVMSHRYANEHERVKALDDMAANLLAMTKDESKVWLPDIKVVGFGQQQQVVDIVRFNAPLFEQTRGALDDIAKEKGERIKRTDVTSNGETVKGYIGVDTDRV